MLTFYVNDVITAKSTVSTEPVLHVPDQVEVRNSTQWIMVRTGGSAFCLIYLRYLNPQWNISVCVMKIHSSILCTAVVGICSTVTSDRWGSVHLYSYYQCFCMAYQFPLIQVVKTLFLAPFLATFQNQNPERLQNFALLCHCLCL